MEDKDSLYSIEQYLAASAKTTPGNYPFGQAPPSSFRLGFELEEESVDFSELVKACEEKDYTTQATNDYSSSGYWYQQKPPGMNNEEEASTPFLVQTTAFFVQPPPAGVVTTSNPHDLTNVSADSRLPSVSSNFSIASPPIVQDQPTSKQQMTKKQIYDKNTDSYRDKRERNNIAVRKSRNKTRQRALETEKRVQELEEENVTLKNQLALLQKELIVLKGLFSSSNNVENGDEQFTGYS